MVCVGAFESFFAEDDAAADTGQQAEAVDHVPHRRHHRQSRRAIRPLILAHHGHIHHAVNAGDQRTAKGGRQVFEVQRLDLTVEKIHTCSLSFSMNTQKSRTRTGISACALSGCRFSERLALRAIKRYGSICPRKCQEAVSWQNASHAHFFTDS